MNTIYKVIWNDALQVFQAVNEITKSHRKHTSVRTGGGYHERSILQPQFKLAAICAAILATANVSAAEIQDGTLVIDEYLVIGGNLNNNNPIVLPALPGNGNGINFTQFEVDPNFDVTSYDTGKSDLYSEIVFPDGTPETSHRYDVMFNGEEMLEFQAETGAYTYYISSEAVLSNSGITGLQLTTTLHRIDSAKGVFSVNTNGGTETSKKDLVAQLTGTGGFEYIVDKGEDFANDERYSGSAHLYVSGKDNAYRGETFIGKQLQGVTINDEVIIHALTNNIFGSEQNGAYTSNLKIKEGSGLELGATEQWTHALTGSGYINLENSASLLHLKDTGITLERAPMTVSNALRGAGTLWVNFGGGGVDFVTDSGENFSGWVVLQNAYTEVEGNATPIFHNDQAHLLLADDGVLKIQSAQVDGQPTTTSVSNLAVGFGYTDRFDKTAMSGDSVAKGHEATLEFQLNPSDSVQDYLVVDNLTVGNAKVTVDFGEGFEDVLNGKNGTLLTADEGENKTLIVVTGDHDEADELVVDMGTEVLDIKEGDTRLAEATWAFGNQLVEVADHQWALNYYLQKVNLLDTDGQGLRLQAAADGTTGVASDFTAYITGKGNLTFTGFGATILLGNSESGAKENDYKGITYVTDGANVQFQANKAMGDTKELNLAQGTQVDLAGFDQTVLSLTGTDSLIVDDGAEFRLNSGSTDQINVGVNLIGNAQSKGTFIVESKGANVNFTSGSPYEGNVQLINTNATLSGNTATVLSTSDLALSGTSGLHLSGAGAQLGSLSQLSGTTNSSIVFDNFVLGQTQLTLDKVSGHYIIDLPNSSDFSIADTVLLIEADGSGKSDLIIAGDASGAIFGLNDSGNLTGVNYQQNGNVVAKTDWILRLADPTQSGLGLSYTLTKVDIQSERNLTIDTSDNAITGEDLTLSAQIIGQGGITFAADSDQTIIIGNERNEYYGATTVQSGQLALGASHGLGNTSALVVNDGAGFLLNSFTQTVGSISGNGAIDLGSGTLTVTNGGEQNLSITNAIKGNEGTLSFDLNGGELTVGNTNSSQWAGRVELTDTLLTLSGYAESFFDDVSLTAHSGTTVTVDSQDTLNNLALDSGKLIFDKVILGDADSSSLLTIKNQLSGTGTVEFGKVSVSSALNLLDGDDGDLNQVIISADRVSDGTSLSPVEGEWEIQAWYGGTETNPDAQTLWSANWVNNGNQLDIRYQLKQVNLQNEHTLNLSQAVNGDATLSALVTGTGSINFDGGNITLSNRDNTYTGKTVISSDSLTLGADGALGQTSSLEVKTGTTFNVNGHTQTVGGLLGEGIVNFGILGGSLVVKQTKAQATEIKNLITGNKGTLSFVNAGELSFSGSGNTAESFTGNFILDNSSVNLSNAGSINALVFSGTGVSLSGASLAFGNGENGNSIALSGLSADDSSSLSFAGIDLTNQDAAAVAVSGEVELDTDTSVTVDLVDSLNSSNVLVADDGLNRTLIDAIGGIKGGYQGQTLESQIAAIFNNGADQPVAYGVWENRLSVQDQSELILTSNLTELRLADVQGDGLILDATNASGNAAQLSAKITDWVSDGQRVAGKLTIGGTGVVTIANNQNDYTGQTIVQDGAGLIVTGTLGNTANLANEGTVQISNDDVKVNGLTGDGQLTIDDGRIFTVNVQNDLSVGNHLIFGEDKTGVFAVDGSGAQSPINLTFTQEDNAKGSYHFTNVSVDFIDDSQTGIWNRRTLLKSQSLALSGSTLTIGADYANTQDSLLNNLIVDAATLQFTDITLARGESSSSVTPLLYVDSLQIEKGGLTLDVSANLTDESNLLQLDNSPYDQALIKYVQDLGLNSDQIDELIRTSSAVSGGETIYQNGAAYITWGGGKISVDEEKNIISASYMLTGIQLADDKTDQGLLLRVADGSTDQADQTLSAIISDYEKDGEQVAGNLTLSGAMFLGAGSNDQSNTYTGKTTIKGGTVTVQKNDGFGVSKLLSLIDEGKVHFDGGDQSPIKQILGRLETTAGDALSGVVSLTLGQYDGANTLDRSRIVGANNDLSGALTLVNGHGIDLDNTSGLGSLTINGQAYEARNASVALTASEGTFDNTITGSVDLHFTIANQGTVTFAGQSNDYTGVTEVDGSGTLVLGNDRVLGNTSLLSVNSGHINFASTSQTVGNLQAIGDDALTGEVDNLTVAFGNGDAQEGYVTGANTTLKGSLALTGNGTLSINNQHSLGSVSIDISDSSTLKLSGFGEGSVLDNILSGTGSIELVDSEVEVSSQNTDLAVDWTVSDDSHLLAQGDVSSHIGTGAIALAGKATLTGNNGWTLSNALSGAGELFVSAGASANEFAFSQANTGFTGDITLSNLNFRLSGNQTNNAQTVAGTDVTIVDAILNVSTAYNPTSDTIISSLTSGSGSQIVFTDLTPWNSDYSGVNVGKVSAQENGGEISVSALTSTYSGAKNLTNTQLLHADNAGLIQALINSTENIEGKFNLAEAGDNGKVTQTVSITNPNGTPVAEGLYEFELVQDEHNIDLSYVLTQVDLSGILQLSTQESVDQADKTLSAKVIGDGGLDITGGTVYLTNAENQYSGSTNIQSGATLQATEGALGGTSSLTVSGHYINAGNNDVGTLSLFNKAQLTLNESTVLTITGNGTNTLSGTVTGDGDLIVNNSSLVVTSTNETYQGDVSIGTDSTASKLTLSGSATLGTGAIILKNVKSVLHFAADKLTNLVTGIGRIEVTDSKDFSFASGQKDDVFTGTLAILDGSFNFGTENNQVLSSATLETGANAEISVNDQIGDEYNQLGNLSLAGGVINFGSGAGILHLQGENASISTTSGTTTTFVIDPTLSKMTDANGAAALGADFTSVTLIDGITDHSLAMIDAMAVSSTSSTLQRVIQQQKDNGLVDVARLHGALGGLAFVDDKLNVGFNISQIELLSSADSGYVIGQDGSIGYQLIGTGNLTIAAGVSLTNGDNDYSGSTFVANGGVLTLGGTATGGLLGKTNLLSVADGGQINFNDKTEIIGNLQAIGDDALTGKVKSLTVAFGNGGAQEGYVTGANTTLMGSLALTGNGTLSINNQHSLGSVSIDISDSSTLKLSGFGEGSVLDNILSGTGSIELVDSEVEVSSQNTDLAVDWTVSDDSHLLAQGDVSSHIGTGAIALAGKATLTGNNGWTLSNVLTGEGELSISANGETFSFDSANVDFTGSVYLGNARMSLALNSNDVSTLTDTTFRLDRGAVVTIQTGDDVIDLTGASEKTGQLVMNGGTLVFEGAAGANVGTEQLGQIKVDSLNLTNGGTIRLTVANTTVGETDAANVLTADEGSIEQILIHTSSIVGDVSKLTLDDGDARGINSAIMQGGSRVALGTYEYELASNEEGLGLSFVLTEIDLEGTLNLSGSDVEGADNTLTARIIGDGSLLVESGTVTLANEQAEQSSYTGSTTVNEGATLKAAAQALGNTSSLTVAGSYFNEGANRVGYMNASGNVHLNVNGALSLLGENESLISGALTGSGDLNVQSGTLTVLSENADYSGKITLGTSDSFSVLNLQNNATMGTGTILFDNAKSRLDAAISNDWTLSNQLQGEGSVNVTGTGDALVGFNFNQDPELDNAFSGNLSLTNIAFDLTEKGNDVLENIKLNVTNSILTVNGELSTADRKINGLVLSGGRINFGRIGNGAGVINLQGQELTASADQQTEILLNAALAQYLDENGEAAFMSGDESLKLITNIDSESEVNTDSFTLSAQSGSTADTFTRDIMQGGHHVATIKGNFNGLTFVEDGDYKDLAVNLRGTELVLETDNTYTISETGTISMLISGDGNLGLVGGTLTLSHADNSYTGSTTVSGDKAQLVLAANHALGSTSELNISGGASVLFGQTSQTIGSIHAVGDNALVSGQSGDQKLTIGNGGTISGQNDNFHTNVELADKAQDLTLKNALALGTADIKLLGRDNNIVLSGIAGTGSAVVEFANDISGLGKLTIAGNSKIKLTGENQQFSGVLTVNEGSQVVATGNVSDHIGQGSLVVNGQADLTQTTFDSSNVWSWSKATEGEGILNLVAEGADRIVSFAETSLENFSGTLGLNNLTVFLDANSQGSIVNNSYDELSGSLLDTITLTSGAQAELFGQVALDKKDIVVSDGGILSFNGIATPGSTASGAHLTVDELTLNDNFVINLGIENASIQSGSLLVQDDGVGTSISVATALNGISGSTLDNGTLTVNGSQISEGDEKEIRFAVTQSGYSDETENGTVAEAIYGYNIGVVSDESSLEETLQVSYTLQGVELETGKRLVLSGLDSEENSSSNTLSVYLTGDGDLRIAENTVRLESTEHGSDYSGSTTISSGAKLFAEAGTLGKTSDLFVSGEAHVEGNNEVHGLSVGEGALLVIGDDTFADPENFVTLTLRSDSQADHVISGDLRGNGVLEVFGDGQVDDGIPPDLTIEGSQGGFAGKLNLADGAWVHIKATDGTLFGNSAAKNDVTVSRNALLTIESDWDDEDIDGFFYGVFRNGADGQGGTIEITLGNAGNKFRFAGTQAEAGFNGRFVMNKGTIDFDNLLTSVSGDANPLSKATLELGQDGIALLSESDVASFVDSQLGGLSMNGGSIVFGSINYVAGDSEAHASHINLNNGKLELHSNKGSSITLDQGETNVISDDGKELLAAASEKASIVLIHNIGELYLNGQRQDDERSLDSEYLNLINDAQAKQIVAQNINHSDDPVNVAEVTRTFDDHLTFEKSTLGNKSGYMLSLGYTVDQVGLLYQTDDIADSADALNDPLWQGLTIKVINGVEYGALITDASNGAQGNIVFVGDQNNGALTLSGETNTYHGKTWLKGGANIVFGTDHAFGETEALRVDDGSSVNFGGFDQALGMIFASGDDALQSSKGSALTIGGGLIKGANSALNSDITLTGDLEINHSQALGQGLVTINSQVTLTVNGAKDDKDMRNSFVGRSDAAIDFVDSIVTTVADAFKSYEGSLIVDDSSSLTLSMSQVDEFALSGDSDIKGELALGNVSFDLNDNQEYLHSAHITANAGTKLVVSDQMGSERIDHLTLNGGSTIVFKDGAVPGAVGQSPAHIDLGEGGTLDLNGQMTVQINISDLVNPDLVEDAQDALLNKPITSQDLLSDGTTLVNLISGQVNNQDWKGTLVVEGSEASLASDELTIGIKDNVSGDEVAEGTYSYVLSADKNGLNVSYGLKSLSLKETLRLKGYENVDNTLSAFVDGDGSLEISSGTISLTAENNYRGATTVLAGATLLTGEKGALGQTSLLHLVGGSNTQPGAVVEIHGTETVKGLNVESGATLRLGGGENDSATLTLQSSGTTKTNRIDGALVGGSGDLLIIQGSGAEGIDLVVTSSNNDPRPNGNLYKGDVVLQNDAQVSLSNMEAFGSEGTVSISDQGSVLSINSDNDDGVEVDGHYVHTFNNLIEGEGTLQIALESADHYFEFDKRQYGYKNDETFEQYFKGTLELQSGTFELTDASHDVLRSLDVVLDGNDAVLDISLDNIESQDRYMKSLTLNGGTLEFGSLAIEGVNAEALATHINLTNPLVEGVHGNLYINDTEEKVDIAFRQDATNVLTPDGSEIVNAADGNGSKVILIHGIGQLWLDNQLIEADSNVDLSEHLTHTMADTAGSQSLMQTVVGDDPEQNQEHVADVIRKFGDFGYSKVDGYGNALYVGYSIESISLTYQGDTAKYGDEGQWYGLSVSASSLSDHLNTRLTGSGNIVFRPGDRPLYVGSEGVDAASDYTGRTWVNGAQIVFESDSAFGNTSAVRIDNGGYVNLNGHQQTIGSLEAYGDKAIRGDKMSSLIITGNSTITGTNEYEGSFVFASEGTGHVNNIAGLGQGDVFVGSSYTLEINDGLGGEIANNFKDVENQIGGTVIFGSTESATYQLTGSNRHFSGIFQVADGSTLKASTEGDIADRLGSGSLNLVGSAVGSFAFTEGSEVSWSHEVNGTGNLQISASGADSEVKLVGGLTGFDGTVTVAQGHMTLTPNDSNLTQLQNADLAISGENASITVGASSSGNHVHLNGNFTVNQGAELNFEESVSFAQESDIPLLSTDGSVNLAGSQVNVTVEDPIVVNTPPTTDLSMSDVVLADKGDLLIALIESGQIVKEEQYGGADLVLTNKDGELIEPEAGKVEVSITDANGQLIGTGYYEYKLGSEDDKLGISFGLNRVDVNKGQALAITGALDGMSLTDADNAGTLDIDITGAGGFQLLAGELTLTGNDSNYQGTTIIGNGTDSATLTVGEASSLGNTSVVTVLNSATLVNKSATTHAGQLEVAQNGALILQDQSQFELTGGQSVVGGALSGNGALLLSNNAALKVNAQKAQSYRGTVSIAQNAVYELASSSDSVVTVNSQFVSAGENETGGKVRFDGQFELNGNAIGFADGTYELADGATVTTSSINAIGGEDSHLLITTTDQAQATFGFEYDETKEDKFLTITQQMTKGITFAKSGTGVIELSDSSLGAGAVDVEEGGVIFGEAGSDTRYSTAMTVRSNAWAAGFGAVDSLTVAGNGSFYVGGMTGYNSLVESLASSESADGKTVTFTVGAEGHVGTAVTNSGTIYVGNKTASGEMPTDSDFIGNELVINGDYVTSVDQNGGILDMNAIIAGNDGSKADHVTITGGIKGQGYIDVNYDETASTGGKLDYLGLVSVGEGEDPDNLSLKLKDSIKIDDLYYALMYSTEQNEYYLMSSVTDPGDDPWKTEDVENVDGATRSALAFMQSQVFDLSLHDHVGETLYVDPLTGEEHSTSFWMIQRGDWTKFTNESGQMDSDGHVYTTHLGTDLIAKRTDNATFRVGVLGSFADGQVDVTSNLNGKKAQGEFRGYSAGLYFTAQSDAESGPFADLQLRWNRFNNTVGLDKYHLDGLSVTAEAGWDQLLSKGVTETGRSVEWRVEPHIRAYWTDFGNPEEWTSPVGETMKSEFDNGMLFRLGARTKVASKKGSGPAVQAYAEANWVYNYGDYKTTVSTQYGDVTSEQSATNFAELRMGFEVQFTPKVNVWVEGHHNTGSNDYESSGAMVGFKYQW